MATARQSAKDDKDHAKEEAAARIQAHIRGRAMRGKVPQSVVEAHVARIAELEAQLAQQQSQSASQAQTGSRRLWGKVRIEVLRSEGGTLAEALAGKQRGGRLSGEGTAAAWRSAKVKRVEAQRVGIDRKGYGWASWQVPLAFLFLLMSATWSLSGALDCFGGQVVCTTQGGARVSECTRHSFGDLYASNRTHAHEAHHVNHQAFLRSRGRGGAGPGSGLPPRGASPPGNGTAEPAGPGGGGCGGDGGGGGGGGGDGGAGEAAAAAAAAGGAEGVGPTEIESASEDPPAVEADDCICPDGSAPEFGPGAPAQPCSGGPPTGADCPAGPSGRRVLSQHQQHRVMLLRRMEEGEEEEEDSPPVHPGDIRISFICLSLLGLAGAAIMLEGALMRPELVRPPPQLSAPPTSPAEGGATEAGAGAGGEGAGASAVSPLRANSCSVGGLLAVVVLQVCSFIGHALIAVRAPRAFDMLEELHLANDATNANFDPDTASAYAFSALSTATLTAVLTLCPLVGELQRLLECGRFEGAHAAAAVAARGAADLSASGTSGNDGGGSSSGSGVAAGAGATRKVATSYPPSSAFPIEGETVARRKKQIKLFALAWAYLLCGGLFYRYTHHDDFHTMSQAVRAIQYCELHNN